LNEVFAMKKIITSFGAMLALTSLSGCYYPPPGPVAYAPPPPPGYYAAPAPAYYYPPPAYYGPSVGLDVGIRGRR
jgi:hypothetical protein